MRVLPPVSDNELADYFARIGFDADPKPDLTTLQALHNLHPLLIPFENLNSFTGRAVSLHPDTVFSKLVLQGRGGYCFEQNQLFMRVLQAIGFDVQGLSARVLWNLPEDVVMPRTHMALLVNLEGRLWLADVGFGGLTMTAPLALGEGGVQVTSHEDFRVEECDGLYRVLADVGGEWRPLYEFSREPCLPVDYETANWYVSTHPESRFVNQLICARVDAEGRHALAGRRYSRHQSGAESRVVELASPLEVLTVLRDQLQLDLAGLDDLVPRLDALFTREA